ncbi:MAG: wax ester/triacylglycerol synthase family O-acyltransferase [Polyangiaceae bacterium]
MAPHFADRLSALDASFLDIETTGSHMEIGAVATFELGPLRTEDGGVDFARIARFVESSLPRVPRYRQRILRAPIVDQPYWVDDHQFRLNYHLRHTALPRPGDERQLHRLAGRIFGHCLDPARPLWELWVVEGLRDDRFALIFKAHHALADGIAGAGILTEILTGTERDPEPWTPRPPPPPHELLQAEVTHRAAGVPRLVSALRDAAAHPLDQASTLRDAATGALETLRVGLSQARPSPLNPPHIGPHRRFDACRLDLEAMKAVKRSLGGTINDVVLTVATGAIARYLERLGEPLDDPRDFRALVPVNTRQDTGIAGNRVALMFVPLPLALRDPIARHTEICRRTAHAKHEGGHATASELFEDVANWTATTLVTALMKVATFRRAFNVVITNVPGPPFAMHLLGARLLAVHPRVPLYENQALGLALFSYDGGMYWGLNTDWSSGAHPHLLVQDIQTTFAELHTAATQ